MRTEVAAIVGNILLSLGMGVAVLLVVLLVTGESLAIDFLTVTPIPLFSVLDAIGVNFLLGGIALIYTRVRGMFQIIQFVFIGLISLAITGAFWPRLFPVGQGAWMLNEAMANGRLLRDFSPSDYAILVGISVVFPAFGYLVFTPPSIALGNTACLTITESGRSSAVGESHDAC